jgi:flagellar motility protein MotE (MotC chaperone)
VSNLKEAVAAVEGIYAASLPWVRERSTISQTEKHEIGRNAAEIAKALADTLEASAIAIQETGNPLQDLPADHRTIEIKGSGDPEIPVSLRELVAAVSDLRLTSVLSPK